jgi:hypothetical protein
MLGWLTGFGLAAASGLNAYVPLLVAGLLARHTNLLHLHAPYDKLTHPVVLVLLAIVAVLDFFGDKVPVADHFLHALGIAVHPAAGVVVSLAANSDTGEVNMTAAAVFGFLVAGAGHLTRAAFRPLVTATTGGLGTCVVSLIEDVIALVLALLAVIVPILAFVVIVIGTVLMGRQIRRAWRRLFRRRLRPPPLPRVRRRLRPPPLPAKKARPEMGTQ